MAEALDVIFESFKFVESKAEHDEHNTRSRNGREHGRVHEDADGPHRRRALGVLARGQLVSGSSDSSIRTWRIPEGQVAPTPGEAAGASVVSDALRAW